MMTAIYEAGLEAGKGAGTRASDNPYDLSTEEGLDWDAGFYVGYYAAGEGSRYFSTGKKWAALDDDLKYVVGRVYAHARKHYNDGWDVLVETVELAELVALVTGDMTPTEAVTKVAEALYLEAYNDRRNDALAAGGLETTTFKMGV